MRPATDLRDLAAWADFTVNPRVRRIAAHAPDELSPAEFYRQMFWSSGVELPDDLQARIEDVTLDLIELPAGERRSCRSSYRLGLSSSSTR